MPLYEKGEEEMEEEEEEEDEMGFEEEEKEEEEMGFEWNMVSISIQIRREMREIRFVENYMRFTCSKQMRSKFMFWEGIS